MHSKAMRLALLGIATVVILGAFYFAFREDGKGHAPEMLTLQSTLAPSKLAPSNTSRPEVAVIPVPRKTLTPTSTATDTATPTETPTFTPSATPIPSVTSTQTPTETSTPTNTATETPKPRPITTISPYPPLPSLNTCSPDYQNIIEPKDLAVVEYGREWLTVKGTADWPGDFGEYQIAIYRPNGTRQPIYQLNQPVINGLLWQWNFENTTISYGEGWYIIRLLVVKKDGNFIDIGQHDGCHIRVYLPPPS